MGCSEVGSSNAEPTPTDRGASQHRDHLHWTDDSGRIIRTSKTRSIFELWFPPDRPPTDEDHRTGTENR